MMIPPIVADLLDGMGLNVKFAKAVKAYALLKSKPISDYTAEDIQVAADVVDLELTVSPQVFSAVTEFAKTKDLNKASDMISDPEAVAEFTAIVASLVGVLFKPKGKKDQVFHIEGEISDTQLEVVSRYG